MDKKELEALMRTVEVLSIVRALSAHPLLVQARHDMLARFRKTAGVARHRLSLGKPVKAELANDLRFVARNLLDMQGRIEASEGSGPIATAMRIRLDAQDAYLRQAS